MIKKVILKDFRNFPSKTLEFFEGTSVIIGPNASGKTNILESIFLLSTGKSFKAKIESEMIKTESDLARVVGTTSEESLEAVLTRGENGWPRKRLLVNGVPKRLIDFSGNLKTVLFGPWDMDLISGSPSIRRRYLDAALSQVDREYRRSTLSYEKGLRQRNRLLLRIREEGMGRSHLLFWDQLLIRTGNYISEKRRQFVEYCNGRSTFNGASYNLFYDSSAVSETRLAQYKTEEVAAATTLVGPHRDDISFKVAESGKKKEKDLSTFGSRGEQRMAILWAKEAELNFIEEAVGERPTLLLDDIFSELDHEHRSIVMDVAKKGQTIITTADKHFVEGERDFARILLKE